MIETGDTMEDTMKRVHQAEVDKAGYWLIIKKSNGQSRNMEKRRG